jgi:hypothetical protein
MKSVIITGRKLPKSVKIEVLIFFGSLRIKMRGCGELSVIPPNFKKLRGVQHGDPIFR